MSDHDLSRDFALHASACRFEDLSPGAIDIAKKSILDILGVSLAASGTVPTIGSVMEIVRENGGNPQCSILGFGEGAPPLMAAFANGAMAHCLDFDDMGADGHHPTSTLVPAVFACAEKVGGISGKDLITAVAIGQDMFLRIRRGAQQRLDWLATTVLGVFSATVGACYALRLDADQTTNALGLSLLGSSGTLEMRYGRNSDLGQLYAGFVAKSAVLSALLAQKGVTGTQRVFEGKAGVLNVYFSGVYDRPKILDGLGQRFTGETLIYKPWPVNGLANSYIHATQELIRQNGLETDDIAEIRAYAGDFVQQMCYPLDIRQRPESLMDARFSLPFILGAVAAHGEVRIDQFTEAGLRDPADQQAARKVVPVDDAGMNWTGNLPTARVDIVTRDGRTLSGTGDGTLGNTDNPMLWPNLAAKFAECAALAANNLSPQVIADVTDMIGSLEAVDDATVLMRALSSGRSPREARGG